ncbi:MAG: argininosuccinate lyase [Clostridia bacterium]|nr:argininosuccinate lyase [Clostridia bacterium]
MKMWSGRFTKETDELVEDFHSSISFDSRLYKQDIRGSIAHARMLGEQGIISKEESRLIIEGLREIEREIEEGKTEFSVDAEDIHMNIEKILTEKIGEVGKKLHTARSRNDQVALDMRMYLKEEIKVIMGLLADLQQAIVDKAEKHLDVIMPGYTHLQKAQPVLFSHHLLAYFEMFQRDFERLLDCRKRTDVMPLGSGALAGTTFPIDRERVKEELGFRVISRNSMDAVSDRDFVLEFLFCASMIMMHLSRFCEEIILWSTNEFGFVEVDDAYGTGSSIMPQKKNPDVAELVRGKTGRVYGSLMALLTVMKSLPLAYNKDMQEDKENLFDALDTVKGCLQVFIPMLDTLKIFPEKMHREAQRGFANATDVADYLAEKGIPFREAHEITGRLVLYCIERGITLGDLSLEEFKKFSGAFEEDIHQRLSIESCVMRRDVPGATGPRQVSRALTESKEIIRLNRQHLV